MTSDRRDLIRTTYDRLAVEYANHLADELAGKPLDRQLLDRFADEVRGAGPACDLGCGPGHVARYLGDRGVEHASRRAYVFATRSGALSTATTTS
jgi:hypothetical protein